MYLIMILLVVVVLPIASVAIEFLTLHGNAGLLFLFGKWFVFWAGGIRLLVAGVRQTLNPTFTAETIFGMRDKNALAIVQELGFGNLAIGVLGAFVLLDANWIVPAAICSVVFYGLAGLRHLGDDARSPIKTIAMISNLYIFLGLAVYLVAVARAG